MIGSRASRRLLVATALLASLLPAPGAGLLLAQTSDPVETVPLLPAGEGLLEDGTAPAVPPAADPAVPPLAEGAPQPLVPAPLPSAALPGNTPPPGQVLPGGGTSDPEGLGVLSLSEGSLGADLWQGTDRRVVEALLPRLPVNTVSPTLFDLARRLLLTDAPLPPSLVANLGSGGQSVAPMNLLAVRLERLAALGDLAGLNRLLDRLPSDQEPLLRQRLALENLLAEGDEAAACLEARAGDPSGGREAFWTKALLFCQIRDGERAAAELSLAILRDSATSADLFFLRLAEAALGLQPLTPSDVAALDPERIRPLEFALIANLGLPLPPSLVREGLPHTRLQLVHDDSALLVDRTAAAEWAVASRRLPPETLAGFYAGFPFTPGQVDDALASGFALNGVEARALYFQSISRGGPAEVRTQVAELALDRAQADGVYEATARLMLPALGASPEDPGFAWFADTAGRALYALGRYEEATAWLLLARQEAAVSAQAAVAAHRLWPYSRLAGVAIVANEAGLEGWRYAQPDPAGARVAKQLRLLRVLFQGLGENDAMPWIDLALGEEEAQRAVPDASLLYALEDASFNGRLGETILLALLLMGERPPADTHPLALNAALTALMRVGLSLEARALAIEAALGNGI
jgi:hypothetical protein